MAQKELDEFFKGLPAEEQQPKADIFGENKTAGEAEKTEAGSEEDEPKKNRHHRRLEAKLQAERESAIQLAAELKATKDALKSMSEISKFRNEIRDDVQDDGLKSWLKIYGDTPEHREAYEVLTKNVLAPISQKAQKLEEELAELKNREVVEKQLEKQFSDQIDRKFEKLEDDYDVDITSDTKEAELLKNAIVTEIKRISPKDENGEIIEYGDFNAALENVLSKTKQRDTSSQKRNEIASRSMANSTTSDIPKQRSKGWDGWRKDLL